MTLDEMVFQLERGFAAPGTQIVRQLDPDGSGLRWCVAVGGMTDPKFQHAGSTIREALQAALAAKLDRVKWRIAREAVLAGSCRDCFEHTSDEKKEAMISREMENLVGFSTIDEVLSWVSEELQLEDDELGLLLV